MSAAIRFYQPGIYPRSERVVATTRGLERRRVTQAEAEVAYEQDLADFVEVQQQAHVDYFSDGLLRWQDIFRPLALAADMPARILTRRFDNNAFFRAPEIDAGRSHVDPAALPVPEALVPHPRVATLPSPYMFSRAAVTSADRDGLMRELARDVLRPAAARLAAAGCELIHLQEPWLAYHGIDRSSVPALERALAEVGEGLDARIVLHLYFGDAAPFLDWLRRMPVHAVGVDLVETDHRSLGAGWEIGLLAGCVDGRSSVVEDVDRTAELVRRVAETAQPPVLYVSSSCDLDLLPREVAQQKVLSLGRAVQRIAEPVAR